MAVVTASAHLNKQFEIFFNVFKYVIIVDDDGVFFRTAVCFFTVFFLGSDFVLFLNSLSAKTTTDFCSVFNTHSAKRMITEIVISFPLPRAS